MVQAKNRRQRRSRRTVPRAFLIPAVLLFSVMVVGPVLGGVGFSFSDLGVLGAPTFVGLENYERILSDQQAIASVANTILLAVTVVIGQNVLGLALALALERAFPGRDALRALFLLPAILSPVIIGYLWQYLYAPEGAINAALDAVGAGALAQPWLGNPALAIWAVALTTIWQMTGYAMVIYVAGLHGISEEVMEAAELDGANAWQRLLHIKVPLLAPAITINIALSLIGGLRLFDQVLAMTAGGPGYATATLASVIYKTGFEYGELGYSLALSIVLTIFVAVLATAQVLVSRRAELNR